MSWEACSFRGGEGRTGGSGREERWEDNGKDSGRGNQLRCTENKKKDKRFWEANKVRKGLNLNPD